MGKTLRLLLIEDFPDDALLVLHALQRGGYEVMHKRVETAEVMRTAIENEDWDIIICDYNLPQFNALDALALLQDMHRDLPFIVLSGEVGEDTAVTVMRAGAHDYMMKDNLVRLVPAIERELREANERHARRRAEEALRQSEARFRLLVENTSDTIAMIGVDGMLIYASPALERVLGYKPDDLVGENILEHVHADDVANFAQVIAATAQNQDTVEVIEGRWQRADGTWHFIEGACRAFTGEAVVEGCVVSFRDVTERKLAEQALRESEMRYRAIVEDQTELICRFLPGGELTFVNNAYARYFEKKPEALIGQNFMTFIPVEEQAIVQQRIEALGPSHQVFTHEYRVIMPSGEVRWQEWINRAIFDRQGVVFEYQGVGRDITEAKRADENLQRQLERLAALRSIDIAITASLDLRVTLSIILDKVTTQLDVEATAVLLFDPYLNILEYTAGRGFHTNAIARSRLRLGEGYAGQVALERKTVVIENLVEAEAFTRADLLAGEHFVAYCGAPLIVKGQVRGVLDVFTRTPLNPDEDWLDFLEMLAGEAAIAIDNATLFDDLQRSNAELTRAYDETLEGWAQALELRDHEMGGHTQRVTDMTLSLAQAMGMNNAELVHVRRGALLHDIGKMGIPDEILLKPGKLTDAEWEVMRRHPVYAFEWLTPIAFLRPALDIPLYHHEKWAGNGYPYGLKGQQIPLEARIFAIVDVWDALGSDRPYKKRWPAAEVREYIASESGKYFDPKVVEAFLAILDSQNGAAL